MLRTLENDPLLFLARGGLATLASGPVAGGVLGRAAKGAVPLLAAERGGLIFASLSFWSPELVVGRIANVGFFRVLKTENEALLCMVHVLGGGTAPMSSLVSEVGFSRVLEPETEALFALPREVG